MIGPHGRTERCALSVFATVKLGFERKKAVQRGARTASAYRRNVCGCIPAQHEDLRTVNLI
jgi:hypothetical protein